MKNLGISIGVLATVFSFAAGAQTINVMALDQAGAQTVLQAAKENAEQRNAPSLSHGARTRGVYLRRKSAAHPNGSGLLWKGIDKSAHHSGLSHPATQ
jgi:hypothetical protein